MDNAKSSSEEENGAEMNGAPKETAVKTSLELEDKKKYGAYIFGILVGGVTGFMVSKVYQIWAILYRETPYDMNRSTGWMTDAPPTWVYATENPNNFHYIVIMIFIVLGALSAYYFQMREEKE